MDSNNRVIKEINGEVRVYVREELIKPTVLEKKLSSFPDCHIRAIEQSGKRKAHYGLFDKNNKLVFEVAAPQRSAYARMAKIKDLPIMNVKLYKNPSYSEYTADFLPDLRPLQDYSHPIKRIVLDTETTGLYPGLDEILQISIIDGDGNMLLNNYYKPEHVDSWAAAARINHITKAMVKDKPSVYQDVEKIQAILNRAQEVVIYNAPFDLSFWRIWICCLIRVKCGIRCASMGSIFMVRSITSFRRPRKSAILFIGHMILFQTAGLHWPCRMLLIAQSGMVHLEHLLALVEVQFASQAVLLVFSLCRWVKLHTMKL